MSSETIKGLMEKVDHTVEDNKDTFKIGVFKELILAGLGIDDCVRVERGKYKVVVSKKAASLIADYVNGKNEHPILLAYLSCSKYYLTLKEFLKNSYNYYRDDSLPMWKDSYVYDHIYILEDWKFDCNRVFAPGFKYLNEKEFNEMKKFDYVIGNPAFNNGLDLKIHKVFGKLVNEAIVFVHPSGFVISHKEGVRKCECKDVDMTKMESLHMFWGNELFNIGLFVPVVVSVWKPEKTNTIVKVVDDAYTKSEYECECNMVHLHGKMYSKIIKWLKKNVDYSDNIASHGGRKVVEKFGYVVSAVRGHPPRDGSNYLKDDFFTIIPNEQKSIIVANKEFGFDLDEKEKNRKEMRVFSFKTEKERNNFIKYLKTKIVRFILSLSKISQNIFNGELNQIPWMDFNEEWTDAKLRKMWNIDDKMWEYINKFIPDFYSDYNYGE